MFAVLWWPYPVPGSAFISFAAFHSSIDATNSFLHLKGFAKMIYTLERHFHNFKLLQKPTQLLLLPNEQFNAGNTRMVFFEILLQTNFILSPVMIP